MSFGLSPGDIIKAIEFAIKIYDYGFAEENRKDVRYRNFRNEILNFRILLQRLDEALTSAQDRYVKRGPALGRPPYEPLSREFELERKTIIGNFYSTLEDCDALLRKNRQIRERNTNVLENLMFNLTQQEVRVDHLRHRLHFHSQKIRLVIDRLSLNLLTDLDAKVDDILAISEQNLQVSNEIRLELKKFRTSWLGYVSGNGVTTESASEGQHAVTPRIAQRFYQKLLEDAPTDLRNGLPLQNGFDALLLHFEHSCEPGADQTPERYLLFLKARWLLDRLKEGSEYKIARPGFYYKRAINQIEQAVGERIAQPGELIAYDEGTLLDLADTCFQIWTPETPFPEEEISQPSPLMVRGDEVQVVHLNLADSGSVSADTLTVFKSSEEHFRVVHESNPASTQGRSVIMAYKVHIIEDRLIPHYAFPTLTNPCLDLAIFSRNEESLFRFGSLADLHELQTALMGYEVSHDQGDRAARCQLKFKHSTTVLDSSGRLQLWQEPIGSANERNSDAQSGSGLSSLRTQSMSQGSHSRHDSLALSIPASSTINMTEEGFEATRVKLPAITCFTQITEKQKTRFALIFINLLPGMIVNPKSCSCHRGYDQCANLVIEFESKRDFPTQMLFSDTLSDGQPNPNTFDIFPMRLPKHPDSQRRVVTRQTEYVLLKFKSLDEKIRFHQELDLRFEVRDRQIEDQIAFERKFMYEMDKPRRPQSTFTPGSPAGYSPFSRSPTSLTVRSNSRAGTNGGTPSGLPISPRTSVAESNTMSNLGLGLSGAGASRHYSQSDTFGSPGASRAAPRPNNSSSATLRPTTEYEASGPIGGRSGKDKKTKWFSRSKDK